MNHDQQAAAAIGAVFLGIIAVGVLFWLIVTVCYCLTLSKAFRKITPANRTMDPNLVWLLLIPCVGAIFHFFIVINLAKSLEVEFAQRGITMEGPRPGQTLGLVTCGLILVSSIPYLNFLTGLPALICWIIYWIKVSEYSKKLGA